MVNNVMPTSVGDILHRTWGRAPTVRIMPKWQADIAGLSKQHRVAEFGDIRRMELDDGRRGYLLPCDVYGNLIIVEKAPNVRVYEMHTPNVTDYWRTVVGYANPVDASMVGKIAAVYHSILDGVEHGSCASCWFEIVYAIHHNKPRTAQRVVRHHTA